MKQEDNSAIYLQKKDEQRKGRRTIMDDILRQYVGRCGLWQISVISLLCFCNPTSLTLGNFLMSTHRHRCRMDNQLEDYFNEISLAFENITKVICPDGQQENCCQAYNVNQTTWKRASSIKNDEMKRNVFNLSSCENGYIYADEGISFYPDTVVKEFNLVCSIKSRMAWDNAFYSTGISVGFIIGGYLADTFGRKSASMIFSTSLLISTVIMVFVREYWQFCLIRFISASSSSAVSVILVTMCTELTVPESTNILLSIYLIVPYFLSQSFLSFLGWFMQDSWRHLQLAQTSPVILSLSYYWLLPESPRWLHSKGRFKEMRKVLEHGRRVNSFFTRQNKEHLVDPETFYEILEKDLPTKPSSLFSKDCFATLVNRRTVILVLMMGLNYSGLLGTGYYLKVIKESVYLTNFLLSIANVGSSGLLLVTNRIFQNYSRRTAPCLYLSFTGILLIVLSTSTMIFGIGDISLVVVIFTASIILQTTFSLHMLFVTELFPSSQRNQSLGYAMAIGRLTVVFTDYLVLLDGFKHGLPLLIQGGLVMTNAVMAGCLLTKKFFNKDYVIEKKVDYVGDNNEII